MWLQIKINLKCNKKSNFKSGRNYVLGRLVLHEVPGAGPVVTAEGVQMSLREKGATGRDTVALRRV